MLSSVLPAVALVLSSTVPDVRLAYERWAAAASPTRCIRVHRVEVLDRQGDTATVRAQLTKWTDMPGGTPWHEEHNAILTLRDGAVTSVRVREDELAARIAALPHAARAALIAAHPDLQTPALAYAISMQALDLFNKTKRAEARELLALADPLATDDASRAIMLTVLVAIEREARGPGLIEDVKTALALAERSGNPDAIGWALVRYGRVAIVDEWETGTPFFHRALAIAPYIENAAIPSRAATQLAHYSDTYNRHVDALRYAELAARYASRTDDIAAHMSALANLGGAYNTQYDHELARPHFEKALVLAREAGYMHMVRDLLAHLALGYAAFGDYDMALRAMNEAIAIGPEPLIQNLHAQRAGIFRRMGDDAAARADLTRSVNLAYRHRKRPPVLQLHDLAALEEQRGRHADALELLEEARCQADAYDAAKIRPLTARVLHRLGRSEEALAMLRAYIRDRNTEQRFGTERERAIGRDSFSDAYLSLCDLLVDLGRPADAYLAVQEFRGRTLLEAVSREQPPLTAIMTPVQLAEYRRREKRVVELNKAQAPIEELTAARIALSDFAARVRGSYDAAYAAAAAPPPAQDGLPAIPAGVAVVEYVVGDARTIAFTLSGGRVEAHVIDAGSETIREAVDDFVARIERRDLGYRPAARKLYDLLLAPVASSVAGKTLCIVPHRDLWRLPFHALRTPAGKHLAETHALFYAPASSMLSMQPRRREPEAELLAIANPRLGDATVSEFRARYRSGPLGSLPEAEEEVRALARLYGKTESRIYVRNDAREAAFKAEAGKYRVLHIATHGILDGRSPMFSSLLMAADPAEDGLLEAREIANLRLSADVAVLAACDTGRGRISPGEGVIGMSWALLVAGCPNVVVSHWKADSAATSKLMVEMHRRLVGGAPLASAMRSAQRALMKEPRYSHPFYWAAFNVVGSGRPASAAPCSDGGSAAR